MKPVLHIGDIAIPTYLLIISLSYSLLLVWLVRRAENFGYEKQTTLDLSLAVMVGGFLGGRLFHVAFEQFDFYLKNPVQIFYFWRGGFVFYGGALGAWLASELVIKKYSLTRGIWQDLFTPLFPLGYALGRLGCFSAGCCFGHHTTVPWSVSFPPGVAAPANLPIHPTQLYASLWDLSLLAAVLVLERSSEKRVWKIPGFLFTGWFLFHAIGRLIMEHYRADDRGQFILGLSISSWISYLLILISASVLIKKVRGRVDVSGTT